MPTLLQHSAAGLFSTAVFRPIVAGESPERANRAASRLRDGLRLPAHASNEDVTAAAYAYLRREYRTEYFYRNLIASKILVGRHRASGAVLLNEFRVGGSVADCVLINGRGVVYEIKTEYDSPEKLMGQLANYYRAFTQVNVVTHASQAAKYERLLKGSPVGLLAVGARGAFSIVQQAESSLGSLDVKTMFNSLRQGEVESILRGHFGSVPVVPNGIRYTTHLALAQEVPAMAFQEHMLRVLKGRELTNSRDLVLDPCLEPLRALLVQLDPDRTGRRNLGHWLKSKESLVVLPLPAREAVRASSH